MLKIEKEKLPELFAKIAAGQELYLPVNISGQVNFAAWDEEVQVDLTTLKSVKSPKDAFFPQSENLYTCKREGKKITIEPEELKNQSFVVFGMKACDVQGLKVLDQVFLSDPVDTFYAARREHGVIVALACHEPEETCFCKVFGIDCAEPAADVAAWMAGEEIFFNPSPKRERPSQNPWKGCLPRPGRLGNRPWKKRRRLSAPSWRSSPIPTCPWRAGTGTPSRKNLILPCGRSFTSPAWPAAPVPLCAPPASATISRTLTREAACSVTAAGIPACIQTLP